MIVPSLVLALLPTALVATGDDGGTTPSITIEASPSLLREGIRCRVDLHPSNEGLGRRIDVSYEGEVAKATDEGLLLAVTEDLRAAEVRFPPFMGIHLPFYHKVFRNFGDEPTAPGGKKKEVWIPTAKIRSVRVLTGSGADAGVR